ncbi:hypothetical protein CK936_09360, partial [Streptomyces albireticuli]
QKAGDGVFYSLALTFGTLLSSQGTDASFVLTLSGFPPGASLRCFQPYQIRFPFPPPLKRSSRSEFRFRPPVGAGCFAPSGVFTTLAAFPAGS